MVITSHGTLGDTTEPTGFYVPEAAHPWAVLRGEHELVWASPAGGAPPRTGDDADGFLADPAVAAALAATTRLRDIDPADVDAVFVVGGHGTMWDLPGDPDVQRILRDVHLAGGPVAAVCHGPAALTEVRLPDGTPLVAGRRVAAFTNEEERRVELDGVVPFLLADRLTERGATHVAAPAFTPHVVTDGTLLTGQNPQSARPLAEALRAALAARVPA